LADAIRFICENPEIYIKMSKNALKRFEEEFTIEIRNFKDFRNLQ